VAADPAPRQEYARRMAERDARIAEDERAHLVISNLRLADAAVTAFVLWRWVFRGTNPAWLFVPIAAFLYLVGIHARTLNRLERSRRARRWYQRGIDRIEGTWTASGPTGDRFGERHPYARDLDLFGRGSLFHLIDTARTESGEETLAAWLSAGADAVEIRERQRAIAELKPMLDFREDIAVIADETVIGRTSDFAAWIDSKPARFPRWLPALLAFLAAVGGALAVLFGMGQITLGVFVGWTLVEAIVARLWHSEVARVLAGIDLAAPDLPLLAELLERI
jgi:hypothetical protein